MTAPTGGSDTSDLHQRIQETAQLQNILNSLFGAFGINAASLEMDPGEDAGQYFELNPAEVREDMKLLQKVIDKAGDLLRGYGEILGGLNAPAGDDPSHKQALATRNSIVAAQKQLVSIVKYSTNYYNKLARSVGDYEAIEKVNTSDFGNAGGNPSGTAV